MADDKTRILTAEDAARLAALAGEPDDRTRVLSAEEATQVLARARGPAVAGGVSTAPRLVGDKIVFFCSNGHRITVDKSLAGKRGNCSKQGCGVPVSIPVPPGLEAPVEGAPAEGAPAEGAPEPVAEGRPDAQAGFDIDGAMPSLQPAAMPEGPPPGPAPAGTESPLWGFVDDGSGAMPPGATHAGPAVSGGAADWAADVVEIDHPTARLVARLWQERSHGGIVEVHLSGGGVILPEFYDPRWSCGDHAVFAALAPDGTVTLTAVAWDQVQRVVVRQVQGKPDGMFGD